MPVGTPTQPDFESQNATIYKGAIDNAIAAQSRLGWAFAPHESDPPAMTVTLAAGALFAAGTLTEVAAQTTGIIVAPAVNPRIDRVVIDAATGAAEVVAGAENPAPTPPAIPAGKLPVAQVLLATATTAISNLEITDERVGAGGGSGLSAGTPSDLTIDAGAVTVTGGYHTLRNEGAAGTDELDTIDASALPDGFLLVLAAGDAGEVPTVQHGTGNVSLAAGDFVLDSLDKRLVLQVDGGNLVEVSRSGQDAPFKAAYTSAEQTITAAGSLTLAHGLGVEPESIELRLVCKTTELGYPVDDVVLLAPGRNDSNRGLAVVPDETNIFIRFGSGAAPLAVMNKTTGGEGGITPANWRLVVKAWA